MCRQLRFVASVGDQFDCHQETEPANIADNGTFGLQAFKFCL